MALGHEPDLLIFDEPAASLDPLARRQFLQMIIDLAEPGKRTVLFSTHITSDLERRGRPGGHFEIRPHRLAGAVGGPEGADARQPGRQFLGDAPCLTATLRPSRLNIRPPPRSRRGSPGSRRHSSSACSSGSPLESRWVQGSCLRPTDAVLLPFYCSCTAHEGTICQLRGPPDARFSTRHATVAAVATLTAAVVLPAGLSWFMGWHGIGFVAVVMLLFGTILWVIMKDATWTVFAILLGWSAFCSTQSGPAWSGNSFPDRSSSRRRPFSFWGY